MKNKEFSGKVSLQGFSGFGSYSNSFCWDNGLHIRVEESFETIEWFRSMVDSIKGYEAFCGPNHDTYGLWHDVDYHGNSRGTIIYTINEYGGSRNVSGFVVANYNEKSLRRFSNAMFPVKDYVTPEEEERIYEQEGIFNSLKITL